MITKKKLEEDKKMVAEFKKTYPSNDMPMAISPYIETIERMAEALEFYADPNKYYMRKDKINMQQTTAVFHVDDPEKLPTDWETESPQCSARLRVDQGKTAKKILKEFEAEK